MTPIQRWANKYTARSERDQPDRETDAPIFGVGAGSVEASLAAIVFSFGLAASLAERYR